MILARIKTYIGLAMRAGQCKCGESACKTALMSGDAYLLLLNESMSQGTRNRLVFICNESEIPVLIVPQEADIGEWAGRPGTLCMTINSEGLAGEIMKNYESSEDISRGVN